MAMMDMTGYLKDLVYYQISSKDADKIIIINYDSRNKLLPVSYTHLDVYKRQITQQIGIAGKLLSIVIMYIGRLGPLTIATLWHFSKGERINYPEGNITIG